MRAKTREWVVLNDRLSIVKRDERQGSYYFRARIDGQKGYVFRTTKTSDRAKAEEFAREQFYELQSLAKSGIVVHAKGEFEKAAKEERQRAYARKYYAANKEAIKAKKREKRPVVSPDQLELPDMAVGGTS